MADESDLLLREIEDDLRQDQANKIWTTYGKYIVGLAVLIVAGVAAFQGWKSYDLQTRQEAGEMFAAAQKLVEEDKTEEALTAFSQIAEKGDGYALLARFRTAALKRNQGDLAGALADYAALASQSDIAPYYKNMAIIQGALAELDSPSGASQLLSQVESLNDATNPWRHSAREILGLNALKNGNKTDALTYLKAIAEDATAPQTIKSRTEELLKIIGE